LLLQALLKPLTHFIVAASFAANGSKACSNNNNKPRELP
jgi:hypothetical protein